MITRWESVSGEYRQTIVVSEGGWGPITLEDDFGEPIPDGNYELVIEFVSSGFQCSGSYENPPEIHDERVPEKAYLLRDFVRYDLSEEVEDWIFDVIDDGIYDAEIEIPEYGGE